MHTAYLKRTGKERMKEYKRKNSKAILGWGEEHLKRNTRS